jgi:hypothetical protein
MEMEDMIRDIIDVPDERIQGDWRSQPNPSTFFVKGNDVVVVNANKEFVTVEFYRDFRFAIWSEHEGKIDVKFE